MNDQDDRHARFERKIIQDVNTYGWHVILVAPSGDEPGWAYSIGMFRTLGHPEILMFGLRDSTMQTIINNTGERVRAGARFADGIEDAEAVEGYRCVFRMVARGWYPLVLGFSLWFYGEKEFPVLQLVWPDRDGRYPWDADYPVEMRGLQPLLFEQDPEKARASGLLRSLDANA